MKIAVVLPARFDDAGDFLANVRALEAAGAEMIGVEGKPDERIVALAAIAAITERVGLLMTDSDPASLRTLSRGRATTAGGWPRVAMPAGREGWAELLREQEAAGMAGIVVAWDPRLVDLLRNPDPDDRSDLLMSTG